MSKKFEGDVPNTLAERLTWLFSNITKPNGHEYTLQEVEEGTRRLGYRVTTTAVWKIRNGTTKNPGYLVLQVLAKFFGVSERFFYADDLSVQDLDDARVAATLREGGVEEIAMRSSKLGKEGRDALLQMLRFMVRNGDEDDTGTSDET